LNKVEQSWTELNRVEHSWTMLVNYLPKLCQDSPNSCWENQYFAKCEFVSEWVNFANLELLAQLKIAELIQLHPPIVQNTKTIFCKNLSNKIWNTVEQLSSIWAVLKGNYIIHHTSYIIHHVCPHYHNPPSLWIIGPEN